VRHTNYDALATAYDRRYTEDDYSGIESALLEFIASPPEHVLEVGCGTGHWLQVLSAHDLRPTGLDLSLPMLSCARIKLPAGRLIQGRAEDLPFENHSVDRVFCMNAHHHFADKPAFFAETHRVLRPGGSIMTVALDPHTGTDQWWVYDYFEGTLAIDHERYPSCEQIRDWMRKSGFMDTYSCVVQHECDKVPAEVALQNGTMTSAYTSQLAVLTQDELSKGIERIRAALAQDHKLSLCADLRVYATFGRA
jgi:SAM-dependent methyltransferase